MTSDIRFLINTFPLANKLTCWWRFIAAKNFIRTYLNFYLANDFCYHKNVLMFWKNKIVKHYFSFINHKYFILDCKITCLTSTNFHKKRHQRNPFFFLQMMYSSTAQLLRSKYSVRKHNFKWHKTFCNLIKIALQLFETTILSTVFSKIHCLWKCWLRCIVICEIEPGKIIETYFLSFSIICTLPFISNVCP